MDVRCSRGRAHIAAIVRHSPQRQGEIGPCVPHRRRSLSDGVDALRQMALLLLALHAHNVEDAVLILINLHHLIPGKEGRWLFPRRAPPEAIGTNEQEGCGYRRGGNDGDVLHRLAPPFPHRRAAEALEHRWIELPDPACEDFGHGEVVALALPMAEVRDHDALFAGRSIGKVDLRLSGRSAIAVIALAIEPSEALHALADASAVLPPHASGSATKTAVRL
mmetsp:Transcript_106278/g.226916  ORF Transcript_106278/g.226916 Transcript_106278/m.226916 type:complete len:221 (-) Transcript_106278:1249-1911(-)